MRFAIPHMLWLLFLVPAVAAFLVWAFGLRGNLLKRFASEKALARYSLAAVTATSWLRMGLFLVGLTAVIVALARPQWGYHEQRIISRGVDMMIAIDTSDSMMARDFQPNRLTRAKELLRNLIWEAQGARVGVVAFSGAAAVMCPLTLDYNMAATALKAVDVNTVSAGGTNIGAAINAAISGFEISGGNDRVLILLTDGEQTEQLEELEQAVAKAANEGIKIFAIGIGGESGANIPTMRGFKRDDSGEIITTSLDFKKLQEIASKTGGEAIRAEEIGAGEIAEISAALAQFKGQKQQDKTVRIYHDRYSWFVGAALLCFVLEALLTSMNRITWLRRRRKRGVVVTGAVALCCLGITENIAAYPGESYVRSREGFQEYSAGEFDDALLQYERASQLAPQDPKSLFNLGAAAAKAGKKEEARAALRSVFDAQNPALNAKALYGAATLDHRDIRESIKSKKPEWEGALNAAPNEIEPVKKEIQETIDKLKKVIGEYKDAILTKPGDTDMKANYELAKKDLEDLQKLLDQLNQQQQQQQQQEQPQQNQEQKEQQDQQNQQQSGESQQNQGQQGENQEQQDKQGEQQEQQQDQPEQKDGQEQQKQQDQQGQEQKDQQGEQKQDKNQDGQPGDQQQQDQQPDPKGKPAPTPTPSPTPSGTPRPGEGQGGEGKPSQDAPPVPIGQMSPTDVDRLLNTLPPEDQQALQLMFGAEPNPQDEMQNDW